MRLAIHILFLSFLFGCSGMFYHPDQIEYAKPTQLNIYYDDIFFKSLDGTKLHGWLLKAKNEKLPPKATIVHFHGNAQNISSHFMHLAWMVEHQYQVFIFDYRGFGKSQGSPHQEGIHKDALAAIDYTYELHKKSKADKYIVYAQSLGGTIISRSLAHSQHKGKVDLLVMDSSFSSYQDIAFDKLRSSWLTFIISPLAYLLVSDEMASQDYIEKLAVPILTIHGMKDIVVPFKFGQEIYQLAKDPKWFWPLADGVHTDIFVRHNKKYRKEFIEFLQEYVFSKKSKTR